MKHFKDKLFKTKEGKYVYGQRPNLPANVGAAFGILAVIFSNIAIFKYISLISFGIWSLMEIRSGVNLFRKIYGSFALIVILVLVYAMLL